MLDMPITDLLTTADVAERTGITVHHVSRLVREGKLTPAHQLPGATGARLFDEAEVDRFLAERAEAEAAREAAKAEAAS